MSKGPATSDVMGDLHTALAEVLAKAVGGKYLDENGVVVAPPAALLSVARQFLKDNGIEAQAAPGTPLKSLMSALPFEGSPHDGLNNPQDEDQEEQQQHTQH